MTLFGQVGSATALQREIILNGEQFRKGATAPADVTIGTTPTIPAQRFAAVGELASLFQEMPSNWDQGDISLVLVWALVSAQVNADQLSTTLDYTAPRDLSTGNGVGRASTQLTNNLPVTTANGLAVGDIYRQTFTILAADATNPLASAIGVALEIHLTNTTGVASADLLGGYISYTATH